MLKSIINVYVDNLPPSRSFIQMTSQVQSNAFLHDLAPYNWYHMMYEWNSSWSTLQTTSDDKELYIITIWFTPIWKNWLL